MVDYAVDKTSELPPHLRDKVQWCGACEPGSDGYSTQVIWDKPDSFDNMTGYGDGWDNQIAVTEADCDEAEALMNELYPDSIYCGHTGYCPDSKNYENIDPAVRKRAW